MITNKRVLLVCKESFAFPMFFLAKELIAEGNEVAAFFIHPEESYYKKSLYNENTFYKFKESLAECKLYGLQDFCKEFNERYSGAGADDAYLDEVERDYTKYKNLNAQLTASQLTTRHFHSRFFFKRTTLEQNKLFLELAYKSVIAVLEEFKPDVILDIEDGELLRTVLNEVASKREIPYINIDYPRHEEYKLPTFCLGLKYEKTLEERYVQSLNLPDSQLHDEYEYISKFRRDESIMSKEFKGTVTSQYKPDPVIKVLKSFADVCMYFWSVFLLSGNYRLTRKGQIIFSSPLKHLMFYLKVALKRQMLYRRNKYFDEPVKGEAYVYMPLHMIPESTTFVKAPFYINELFVIEQISKSLPIGWRLYVKEHQAMVGERSLSFYDAVRRIPNVRLVDFKHYDDPKPWIEDAKGVIAISGTGAYESAMLGKNSVVFADVPFALIEGVHRVRSFEDLPSIIASFSKVDNLKSCAAYLSAVKTIGKKLNIKYLISEGEALLISNAPLSERYFLEIKALSSFFADAYQIYQGMIGQKPGGAV